METENTFNQEVPQLTLSENSRDYLKTTAFWTNIMSIINFIGIGFLILGGTFMLLLGGYLSSISEIPMNFGLVGTMYIFMAIVLIIPVLYLYRFGKNVTAALADNNSDTFENALKNMKSYWKFYCIFTIVSIAICVLIVPIAAIVSVASTF